MEDLIAVILFSISATLTPGPNNFMLMNSGLNYGPRRSLPHFIGVCVGLPLLFFITALGFGVVFEEVPITQHILKIIGAAYLLYLAYKILRTHHHLRKNSKIKPFDFIHATIFQWKTPKTWLMANSALATYTSPENYVHSVLIIGLIIFLVSIPCSAAWLYLGSHLKGYLRTENHERILNAFMAAALIVSVVLIFVE
jgi:threonine/homoserine/homoserine lactone efflux protein